MILLTLAFGCHPVPSAPVWSQWGTSGIRVPTEGGRSTYLTCRGGGELWEETLDGPAPFLWSGLLADTVYHCARNGQPFEVALAHPPAGMPIPSITGSTRGLFLFNHVREGEFPKIILVDGDGNLRWWHALPNDPNVGVEVGWLPESPWGAVLLAGGGDWLPPQVIDRGNEVLWSAPPTGVAGGLWHHDVAWLPDRQAVVALSADQVSGEDPAQSWKGFVVETLDPLAGGRPWWWSSQLGIDQGTLPLASPGSDPYHANAVFWVPDDPEGPSFWVSVKQQDQIMRLDEAGDLTWRLGQGGDFALLEADGAPAAWDAWFWGQHAPDVRPTEDPWRWTVFIHDNGMDRPSEADYSQILQLEVDLAARTATRVWTWTEPGWYEPVFGEVDALEDGTVLLAMGHCTGCARAASDRGSSIVVIDPASDAVTWRADLTPAESLYRAEWVDPCAWFPQNRTLCD